MERLPIYILVLLSLGVMLLLDKPILRPLEYSIHLVDESADLNPLRVMKDILSPGFAA